MKQFFFFALLFAFGSVGCKEHRSRNKGERMQEFIIELSKYTRSKDADFILIPQNGPEVFFTKTNPDKKLYTDFLNAVDGIGVEELFYNGALSVDDYRLEMLRKIGGSKKVMVADYLSDDNTASDAVTRAQNEGFISFPRLNNNYDYQYIPSTVTNENTNNITKLSDAQNYLYLISTGAYTDREYYLEAIRQTNFDVVIIDAFWDSDWLTSAEVASLKTKANGAQRLVIAYMSIGSAEKYRYYWQDDWKLHKPRWLKKEYDGYPDEFWVKYWHKDWKAIIFGSESAYADHLIAQGFDGAYLDNVEAYYFLVYND